ncbi:ATP-binding cassette domain-containing protein [Paenibacillus jilunlii]|uniref:ABC-type multidrug transport system, ATPase component n=1 Tax=Paenibacillus jilunlii TaxID=682956 RepID=A0A1G9JWK2_9BACL|nr:ABC transporter ATP-binding protein [Paenibacillus jilunlii]SDL41878.1 ABC-type multidrug transport system, ATPase component [Paenibacillus jilunlii]
MTLAGISTQRRAEGNASPLIELTRATKFYGRRPVLSEVSLLVESGTATALIGRNGSGKSTLLSILAGLTKISSGTLVRYERRLTVGYAPEAFPGLKLPAEQYLLCMGKLAGLTSAAAEARVTELLEVFHLEEFRRQSMAGFSKGMLQKVNLIQSLLTQPQLLLLDEPMSGLDLPAQHTVIRLLQELKRRGTALVFSIHEPETVEALADNVHVLQAGRTVKIIYGQENMRVAPAAYIVCNNIPEQCKEDILAMPGIIFIHNEPEGASGDDLKVTIEAAAADSYLLRVLTAGGSVVSVEPCGGLSTGGLEQWMDPKPAKGGAAE